MRKGKKLRNDPLTLTGKIRAADPAMLFRSGGKTIADHMTRFPAPYWVPWHLRANYQLTAVMHDEHFAAQCAREAIKSASVAQQRVIA